jgi:hypothetical protein
MFIVVSKDQEFQACIGGQLREQFDRASGTSSGTPTSPPGTRTARTIRS